MLVIRALLAAAAVVLLLHALLGPPEGPYRGLPLEGPLRATLIHPYRTAIALASVWIGTRGRPEPRETREYPSQTDPRTHLPAPMGPDWQRDRSSVPA